MLKEYDDGKERGASLVEVEIKGEIMELISSLKYFEDVNVKE